MVVLVLVALIPTGNELLLGWLSAVCAAAVAATATDGSVPAR
jgi:hypothetical protein